MPNLIQLKNRGIMRLAFNKGKDHIINAMGVTEQLLRMMPSHEKRAAIKSLMIQDIKQHKSATESFYEATKEILPNVEESVEKSLLEKYVNAFGNHADRKEIYQHYLNRESDFEEIEEKEADFVASNATLDSFETLKDKEREFDNKELKEQNHIFCSSDGQGLRYHTLDTIGKYTVFPEAHWKRMFPRESPGEFGDNELNPSGKYAIMCTEENLKLTYDLARRTLPKERSIDYEDLIKRSTDLKEILKDEVVFVQLYQDFCLDLLDVMKERDPQGLSKVYDSPSIFDGVIGILLRELRKKPIRNFILYQPTRKKIMNEFTDMLEDLFESQEVELKELKDVIELKRILEVTLNKADMDHLTEFSELNHDSKKYKMYLQGHQKY